MRKILYISLGVIGVIALALFAMIFSQKTPEQTKWFATSETLSVSSEVVVTYESSVAASQEQEKKDISQYNLALEKMDLTVCDTIFSLEKKTECQDLIHASQAQSADTIEACKNLSQTGMITLCEDNISLARAQKQSDKSLCRDISAQNLRTLCEKKVETQVLEAALENNTLSPDLCLSLTGELSDTCDRSLKRTDDTAIYADAVAQKDPEMCQTLDDATFRDNCYDAVVMQLAFAQNDTKYCRNITDITKKSYCEKTLVKKSDTVRFQEIVSNGDIGDCNSLTEDALKYQCSDAITMSHVRENHDSTLCGNLFNTGMQFACMQIANSEK